MAVFYTVVGVRVQLADVRYSIDTIVEKFKDKLHIIKTETALYLAWWQRCIIVTDGEKITNGAPLVIYTERINQAKEQCIELLDPHGLWNPAQFGVWSFAHNE